ncbi:MED7 protein-domain-containing protein [Phycomyces blakesleeanus]|uniref:Mediator of RNA polymerase II transcription subunit 7 n=1 Tax=Phycomyces blakesleeanus TaxID=4837 RepID=A0ABR3B274_PHYBL
MTEQQSTGSAWPDPPSFYKRYTAENVEKLKKARKTGIYPETPISLPPLPDFLLKSLEPPTPPTDSYKIFDQTWQVEDRLATLNELGVKQLFPEGQIDRIKELKKLNRTLIVQYLGLLDILVNNPDEFGQRIENISTIFINMHHILNEYRPHQARETLKLLMENQVAKKRQQAAELRRKSAETLQMLHDFGQEIGHSLTDHTGRGGEVFGKFEHIDHLGSNSEDVKMSETCIKNEGTSDALELNVTSAIDSIV